MAAITNMEVEPHGIRQYMYMLKQSCYAQCQPAGLTQHYSQDNVNVDSQNDLQS